MRCPTCKAEAMGKTTGTYQYRESGLDTIWLEDCDLYACPNCSLRMPILPAMDAMKQAITRELVLSHGRPSGDEIVYLRKAMGLKASELAEILGVSRVTVSRWENNAQNIEAFSDWKLRMEAVDRVLPTTERRIVRDKVSLVLQRGYRPEQTVGKVSLTVAATEFVAASL